MRNSGNTPQYSGDKFQPQEALTGLQVPANFLSETELMGAASACKTFAGLTSFAGSIPAFFSTPNRKNQKIYRFNQI
jgi:hypothetical protein